MKFLSQILHFPRLLFFRLTGAVVRGRKGHVSIGAWFGSSYGDNPKYFLRYCLDNSQLHFHWIGNNNVEKYLPKVHNLDFYQKGSFRALWVILRSEWVVCCHAPECDLVDLPIYRHKKCLNLWHGIPIKYLGRGLKDRPVPSVGRRSVVQCLASFLYDFIVLPPNEIYTPVASRMMGNQLLDQNYGHAFNHMLAIGTPRNDFLIRNANNVEFMSAIRTKYAKILGIDSRKKIVLYMPTWRSSGKDVFTFYGLSTELRASVKAVLDKNNAVLVEKHHYMTYKLYPAPEQSDCSVVIPADRQMEVDVQELYLISALQIGDYSSSIIDFAILKRPCIHFAYDYDEYQKSDSGMQLKLEEIAAGPIVTTMDELLPLLDENLRNPKFLPGPKFHTLIPCEKGESCEALLRLMLSSS